ncbi:hypothetical protein R84B8_03241 [Treponema sp. R8-4-B8]
MGDKPTKKQLFDLAQNLLLHDDIMARCVFGGEQEQRALNDFDDFEILRNDKLKLIECMGNLTTIAGVFLYSKFNQWRAGTGANPDDPEQPNALYLKRLLAGVQNTDTYFDQASSGLRVLRVLDGLYDSFDMNFHVIKYIIINSQIEAGFNSKKNKGLSKLIGFPYEESFRLTCDPENSFKKDDYRNLAEAFNIISTYRNDPNIKITSGTDKYKYENIACDFRDVFTTLGFMKRVSINIDGEGNVNFIETAADGKEKHIPSYGVAKVFEMKEEGECSDVYKAGNDSFHDYSINFYLLEKIEYELNTDTINSRIIFSYQSFNERDSVQVYFDEKDGFEPEDCKKITREKSAVDCFKRISGYLPGSRTASSFFRGMITTSYRYHNVLAPSIVDAIDMDREVKKRILNEFVKKNESTFKEALEPTFKTLEFAGEVFPNDWDGKIDKLCAYITDHKNRFKRIIDWDTLMARILIYEGPSDIIRTVLLHESTKDLINDNEERFKIYSTDDLDKIDKVCKQIIAELEMRYIDNIFETDIIMKNQDKRFNDLQPKDINLFPPDYKIKVDCKALAQSYIDTIVTTLTNIDIGNKDIGIGNNKFAENSIHDTLEIFKSENDSINTDRAFLRTITAFLSFYAGISKCCPQRMSYEFEKSIKNPSPEETGKWKEKIEKEFFIGVSEKAKDLAKKFKVENAVEIAIKELWDFANMQFDDVRVYNAVLARPPVNPTKLAKIFGDVRKNKKNRDIIVIENEEIDLEQAIEKGTLTECLDKKECLKKVVKFLAGEDTSEQKHNERSIDKSNYTGYKEYVKKVVYPQIVTYAKHREDGDLNKSLIMDHTGAFEKWHGGEVQILTEFEYKINNSYYVLPNMNRIETEWWVDPILIPCFEFDKTVSEAASEGIK